MERKRLTDLARRIPALIVVWQLSLDRLIAVAVIIASLALAAKVFWK